MERVMGGKVEVGGAYTPFVLYMQGKLHVASCDSYFEDKKGKCFSMWMFLSA